MRESLVSLSLLLASAGAWKPRAQGSVAADASIYDSIVDALTLPSQPPSPPAAERQYFEAVVMPWQRPPALPPPPPPEAHALKYDAMLTQLLVSASMSAAVLALLVLAPLFLQDLMPLFVAEFLQVFRRKQEAPNAEVEARQLEEQMVAISRAHRAPIVGGNWKCNPERTASLDVLCNVANKCNTRECELYVCPSAMHLALVGEKLTNGARVCAQNCNATGIGAYTGETAPEQLRSLGISSVLLGHSERRMVVGEDEALVAAKMEYALDAGLNVVFAFGEVAQQSSSVETLKLCARHLEPVKHLLDPKRVVLAYQPIWAIGTGLDVAPEEAQAIHKALRRWIATNVSQVAAAAMRIQYGGPVTAETAAAFAAHPDIDGFLLGPPALTPKVVDIVDTLVQVKARPKTKA